MNTRMLACVFLVLLSSGCAVLNKQAVSESKQADSEKTLIPWSNVCDTKFEDILKEMFKRAGNIPYKIDAEGDFGLCTLDSSEAIELGAMLKLILEHRGLAYTIDEAGVYHIIKAPQK